MDQLSQVPQGGSPQPAPQQIPLAPSPQLLQSPAVSSGTPSPAPSKLKNPKLWIGAGALLLVVVVGAAIFLGKPPLLPGKGQLPGPIALPGARPAGDEGAADICAKLLDEAKCAKAAERGCAWADGICKAAGALPPPPTPAADPLEQLRDSKLEGVQVFAEEACNAAREAEGKAQEFANVPDIQTAANQARTACQAATEALVQLKRAATAAEIDGFTNAAQNARNEAVAARDNAVATAEAAANEAANAVAVARREFEEFCKANNLEFKNNECSFNGTSYKNRQALEVALAAAGGQKLEQLRKDKLAGAKELAKEACNAAKEAKDRAQEFGNVSGVPETAEQAQTACQNATIALERLKTAATEAEIHGATADVQMARDAALAARDQGAALAGEAERVREATRREFEEFCRAKNLEWKDNKCIFNDTAYNNRQALEVALAAAAGDQTLEQLRSGKLAGAQGFADEACNAARDADSESSTFPDAAKIQEASKEAAKACEQALTAIEGIRNARSENEIHEFAKDVQAARDDAKTARNKVATLAAAVNKKPPEVTLEEACKGIGTIKEIGGKNACIEDKTGQPFSLGADGKLVALVVAEEVPECPELAAGLTTALNTKQIKPEEVSEAVDELNSLTENKCGFTAGQFLGPFEEEKAKNECAVKDQSVWEWDAGGKICKNKQEARMRDMENLVATLQTQLANAQNTNNNAQINALNQQIATLNSQINELRGSADEPVVITVVAPPAPAPTPAAPPAAPAPAPAAPPSGSGGGGEVVVVATPEVKKEEKKDSKKKKDKKATSDATAAETASASAPAASDSGAAATAPAKTAAAATGSTGAKAASGAASAASASAAHGAFIQGRTGPGILIYPLAVIGANGVYYFLRRRRRK